MTNAEGLCPAQCGGCTPERRAQAPLASGAPCPTSQRLAQFRDESRGHAGSVIVNDGNGRFFEPGAGRSLFAGVSLSRRF